ncbi:MAG: CoA-binding protein [Marinifilaceae bacterium]|nr:CoA-binding protein [Marinifilaceae bacterium]
MKKTIILGASTKEERYSNKAVKALRKHNHEVVAFGIKAGQIDGVDIHENLFTPENVDTISLYLNPSRQIEYYDFILNIKPQRIIFNPGTENTELRELAESNDIYCEEACTLVLLATDAY